MAVGVEMKMNKGWSETRIISQHCNEGVQDLDYFICQYCRMVADVSAFYSKRWTVN
jgi:hypothetical protein